MANPISDTPAAPAAAVAPSGINHLVLNVRDIEESHKFWTEIVGLTHVAALRPKPWATAPIDPRSVRPRRRPPNREFNRIESSSPRKRGSRATGVPLALDPCLRGGDGELCRRGMIPAADHVSGLGVTFGGLFV